MDLRELFTGIAVIIDDEIDEKGKNINDLIKQINDQKIPYIPFKALPEEKKIDHLKNVSFVVLDWKLGNIDPDVKIPSHLAKKAENMNIEFIKRLKKVCFCPLFIFTNEAVEDIRSSLEEAGLQIKGKNSHIFIKEKSKLTDNKMLDEMNGWLEGNPSIYVLMEWEREYHVAINILFNEFNDMSSDWPKIIWEKFSDDKGDKSRELGNLISENLHSRMAPFNFKEEVVKKSDSEVERSELQKVFEGARFIKKENLNKDFACTGDIFKTPDDKHYYLNIRPECDLLHCNQSQDSDDSNNIKLYCLKGTKVDNSRIKREDSDPIYGNGGFRDRIDSHVVPFICDNKIIEFKFKDLEVKDWEDLKDYRKGRLIPPYITLIQQRYALYIQRTGIPVFPKEALPS